MSSECIFIIERDCHVFECDRWVGVWRIWRVIDGIGWSSW